MDEFPRRSAFSLALNNVIGDTLEESVEVACHVAKVLRLHWTEFDFNEHHYTCYSDGSAIRWKKEGDARVVESWNGFTWKNMKEGSWMRG